MVKHKKKKTARASNHKASPIVKYIILAVIVLSMLLVILATLFSLFSDPERTIERKMAEISSDYYENYLYEKALLSTDAQSTADLAKRYEKVGFPIVTLRQLLLFDDGRYSSAASIVAEHCNENSTFVIFFPESPFSKTDYHIEYHYACTF